MKRFIIIVLLVLSSQSCVQAHDYDALLSQSTEALMAMGGDERLHLDRKSGVTKYYTAPKPRNNIILRSSCTSSFPSDDSFLCAQSLHKSLARALQENLLDPVFDDLTNQVRSDIQAAFDRNNTHPYVILTPSGTDAEMVFSLMALLRSKQNKQQKKQFFGPRVLNIILAAGEVGSGTVSACGLRYFNSYLPDGTRAPEKNLLDGLSEQDIVTLPIPARNLATGIAQATLLLERSLEKVIIEAIEEKNQYVVLHAVHCSKTGMGIPSFEFIKKIKKRYQESLIAVVDMAQMRCTDLTASRYLQENICVLVTGSKFFEGPALSGAVLIPQTEGFQFDALQEDELPCGLKSYITRYEIDARLTLLRSMLSDDKNIGLLLRWSAALCTIKNLYKIPESLRSDCASQWVLDMRSRIEKTPHIELLHGQEANFSLAEEWALLGGVNTILSIKIVPASPENHALSYSQLRRVYSWMARDITDLLPASSSETEKNIAKQRCLIGQPVLMVEGQPGIAVLRIALGASMLMGLGSLSLNNSPVHEKKDFIEQLLLQDQIVLEKLSLIGKYFYYLQGQIA